MCVTLLMILLIVTLLIIISSKMVIMTGDRYLFKCGIMVPRRARLLCQSFESPSKVDVESCASIKIVKVHVPSVYQQRSSRHGREL